MKAPRPRGGVGARALALLSSFAPLSALATSGAGVELPRAAPEPIASYRLHARLDEERHAVSGRGKIALRNATEFPTSELYFHLYLNAFEDRETLYLRGDPPRGRNGGLVGRSGRVEVKRLASPRFPGVDLWAQAARHSPGDPQDRTDIRVALPEPLGAGEILDLEIEFESHLPEILDRTGFAGDFHLIAQWFPKLAKREPDGSWAHFAFHPFAEFYADFGNYAVELDVPEGYVVGSTGRLELVGRADGRAQYRAVAPHVHDFAWVAAPGLLQETRELFGIEVHLLSPPEATRARRATWDTLLAGLPFLQRAYGSYPYDSLTVVHPPIAARRAGGMEYPTFFTTGGSELLQALGARGVEIVTIHELAHQWFQGMLASNERLHPFLDEGLAAYSEWRFLEQRYGPGSLFDTPLLRLSRVTLGRATGLYQGPEERAGGAAPEFSSFRALASQIYGRAPLALETLRRVYGPERLERALHTYATRFRFQHPTPGDLYEVIEGDLGADARAFLVGVIEERGTIDFRIGTPVRGVARDTTSGRYATQLPILRRGALSLPVDVLVRFADGSERSYRLTQPKPVEILEFYHDAPLAFVAVDPQEEILIEENRLDNRLFVAESPAPRLSGRLLFLGQLLTRLLSP